MFIHSKFLADAMGFGNPTRYLVLDPKKVTGGSEKWDDSVAKASTVYKTRMHNLFWDNCHSHTGIDTKIRLTDIKKPNFLGLIG